MSNTELRWLEIQFYFVCKDLLQINNNLMDVLDYIDTIAFFDKEYNTQVLKLTAQEILSVPRYKPTTEEFCLICRHFNVPVKRIKEKLHIHNRTLYNLFETNTHDERIFYPKLRKEQHTAINTFINIINKIKGVGI